MQKISFKIPNSCINDVQDFLDNLEIQSFSIFECADMGFSDDLDENGFPIASFFIVEIFDQSTAFLQVLEEEFGNLILESRIEEIDNNDWVAQYIRELKPVVVDGFYIYNDNFEEIPVENDLIPIKIHSALAFGSGDHQTTKSCISMLQYLSRNAFCPKDVLDMGCGSGILAICAAKIWPSVKIRAIDIDIDAVQITKENFKVNNVIGEVFQGSDVSIYNNFPSVDLILCNILKKPLEDLAPSFYEVLRPGGGIITSGFIASQYEDIESCYLKQGFRNVHQIRIDDWFAVLFRKPI